MVRRIGENEGASAVAGKSVGYGGCGSKTAAGIEGNNGGIHRDRFRTRARIEGSADPKCVRAAVEGLVR